MMRKSKKHLIVRKRISQPAESDIPTAFEYAPQSSVMEI